MTEKCTTFAQAADAIFAKAGRVIKLATPLGLGKPNQLLNLIYRRAKADPQIRLELYSALSLAPPVPSSDLEKRFLDPFLKRHFGVSYPRLEYVDDLKRSALPPNVSLREFYFSAGQFAHSPQAQQDYVSLNYTHVARSLYDRGVNTIVQLVAKPRNRGSAFDEQAKGAGSKLSLGCNPDVTLDLADLYQGSAKPLFKVAVVHPDLPYLGGDGEVDESFFDLIVDGTELDQMLFALPKNTIEPIDHLIGYHASRLMPDDGTLQIGIGSLSDALVHALILRHQQNDLYKKMAAALTTPLLPDADLFADPFEIGLYGTSEMVMDGFMHLRRAGILKRRIFDQDEKALRYLHGAFFLGSNEFYGWLRFLEGEDYDGLSMTRVSKVNDLYDPHELAIRRQRKNARFFNTCMTVSLLGGAASDTLDSGEVVSGVGGQYNFVAMSHELPDAHSVLMLRSTRMKNGQRYSNIVVRQGYATIPRHLRDIVITEYGIATLRGKSDSEVVQALIEIADAQFQDALLAEARRMGKVPASYRIPATARNNTPERITQFIKSFGGETVFARYPFGSDFTVVEQRLMTALGQMKMISTKKALAATVLRGLFTGAKPFAAELARMGFSHPRGLRERMYQRLLVATLSKEMLRK